jgi:small subunit ribosomal protein S20
LAAPTVANIASQIKRNDRTQREHDENRRLRGAVRTHFRRLEEAARGGDADATATEHRELVSRIDKAVQKGALHPNNGARKKARAARLVAGDSA